MSSKLGKSNISKPESVNTVSSTSTSELMPPPHPRVPKKTRRFVVPNEPNVPSVPVVQSENVRKRKLTVPVVPNVPNVPNVSSGNLRKRRRSEDNLIVLSNLRIWISKQVDILEEIWEKKKAEQRNEKVNNTLEYLVQAIDSIEKRNEEEKEKRDWINRNIEFMYQQKKREFYKRQRIRRNEEIANTLSMGSNDELKETILRFLNKCHK